MKHIVFAIGSLYGGGAERVVSVWASGLAEKGYKVSVLVYSRLENEYPIDSRVNVYPIANSQKECNDFSMFKRLKRIRKALKILKPDAVISFLPIMQIYVALASIGLKIPRVETIRISPWTASGLNGWYKNIWLWCFKSCDALILQSQDQKPFFNKKVQKKAVVIPNPINSLYVENQKTEYCTNSHRVVAAGRLNEQKNYKMLIDAIKIVSKKHSDVKLNIYGEGPLENQLNAYIKEQGLENVVRLMGRTNELYRVYQQTDLYVMSSDYEGMPNALAEAMAVGLPCISTDCKTGPRDLIDDGKNGYLVPCNDAVVLADKIIQVFSLSKDEQKALGQKAREKIINFCGEKSSLDKLIFMLESLWSNATEKETNNAE
ncbi:MAG: glycosyltransferase family 4 protein [Clostridia bacterium]|nr:glycosyltransferase family 4 protein [Clostridia bacterium]